MWRINLVVFALIVLGPLVLTIAASRVLNELSFPGDLAMIEQLRRDAKLVPADMAEDVMGQVTETNQKIKSHRYYRSVWWGRIVTPAGWEQVEVIDIAHPIGSAESMP